MYCMCGCICGCWRPSTGEKSNLGATGAQAHTYARACSRVYVQVYIILVCIFIYIDIYLYIAYCNTWQGIHLNDCSLLCCGDLTPS